MYKYTVYIHVLKTHNARTLMFADAFLHVAVGAPGTVDEVLGGELFPAASKKEERRVVRRIGAIGSAQLEEKAISSEKEKLLRGMAH